MNFLLHGSAEAATRQESNTTSRTSPTWLLDRDAQSAGPWAGSVRKSSHQSDLSTSKLLEKKKSLTFLCFLALQEMVEGRLLRAQGLLGKAFQNSFIFTITSVTGSHASLPAKQLPNALTTLAPPGRKQQTPNAEKGSRSEQCSILRFRATETSRDPGGGRSSSIAMPPLSLAHLTVPLAQLAPSHQSEKKSS